ncbi:hypothetical protein G6F56_007416 [Rhizopus delemar]|nr:hypothetical protein G6F56_007416 [Rhizopus delemar]
MQASTINDNPMSSQLHYLPDEDLADTFPYFLDPQQEDNLTVDIIQLYQKLLPSKESGDRRARFIKKMENLLNSEWPDRDIKPRVFGSSVNNLGTSSSDIDLCITTPWNGLRNVRVLAKLFRKCGMQHVVCVPRAKVPIVRLFDPEMQLSCDINVNNTVALQNTNMIKVYVGLDPRVRPLIMIVKHWTKQRLLNDAANGGTLSSYTWTCMIINFLQQRHPPILPILHATETKADEYFFDDDVTKWQGFGLKNKESLGGLLYAFFRRFSLEFDYDNQVVSVRQGRYLTKAEKNWDQGRNKTSLCVEEPFNTSRNLGNSADVSSVLGLRVEFQRCLDLLVDQADLEAMFTTYKPLVDHTEIPNHNFFSLTLPTPIEQAATHPYDRRKSMVDGVYQVPTDFHRFSSSQALDSIIQSRNARHGSHPTPLLSQNQQTSIDSLFTRCQKKEASKKKQQSRRKPQEKSRRRSSVAGAEWPSISNGSTEKNSRRWSIAKREDKKTLAEIIKVAHPTKQQTLPSKSMSSSSSSSSSNHNSRQKKPAKNTHKSSNHRQQKNKSNNKFRA